jgi:4-carboxymuconolactone decarboxylase
MPRLPEVTDRNALPEDQRDHFDYLAKTRGAVRLPFSAVLNNPELCYRIAHVGSYIRFEGLLSDKDRELTILASAREVDARFEWAAHSRIARELGISDATIDVIANRKPLDSVAEDEAVPIRVARELLRDHALQNSTFAAAHKAFGDAGFVEIVGTVGYYALVGCLLNGLQIEPAPDAPQLPR